MTTCFGYLLSCTWTHFSPILGYSPRQGGFSMTLLGTYLWRHKIWRLFPPSWILLKSAETERERRRGRKTSLIKENPGTFTGHCQYTNSPKSKNVGEFYWGWMGREHVLSLVKKGGGGQGKNLRSTSKFFLRRHVDSWSCSYRLSIVDSYKFFVLCNKWQNPGIALYAFRQSQRRARGGTIKIAWQPFLRNKKPIVKYLPSTKFHKIPQT